MASRCASVAGPCPLRSLTDYGLTVVEADRPDRSTRRRTGRSDDIDQGDERQNLAGLQALVVGVDQKGDVSRRGQSRVDRGVVAAYRPDGEPDRCDSSPSVAAYTRSAGAPAPTNCSATGRRSPHLHLRISSGGDA
ncbi:hypothetical protein OWR29_28740 [Actinoplanes sp. Pm04-4]|uniref:Uncharacterized protein n=1 Tax=Paractinoplanes pyxinae TaxID=2997416 RepID=A0ABT4B808_9ACTN|nr:hypothetical protein [Actinoplanes pyxinae]MCY1142000.1 hypothetical protein [Actinoplanes pyxinae]